MGLWQMSITFRKTGKVGKNGKKEGKMSEDICKHCKDSQCSLQEEMCDGEVYGDCDFYLKATAEDKMENKEPVIECETCVNYKDVAKCVESAEFNLGCWKHKQKVEPVIAKEDCSSCGQDCIGEEYTDEAKLTKCFRPQVKVEPVIAGDKSCQNCNKRDEYCEVLQGQEGRSLCGRWQPLIAGDKYSKELEEEKKYIFKATGYQHGLDIQLNHLVGLALAKGRQLEYEQWKKDSSYTVKQLTAEVRQDTMEKVVKIIDERIAECNTVNKKYIPAELCTTINARLYTLTELKSKLSDTKE
jgi:hypothetical protein